MVDPDSTVVATRTLAKVDGVKVTPTLFRSEQEFESLQKILETCGRWLAKRFRNPEPANNHLKR